MLKKDADRFTVATSDISASYSVEGDNDSYPVDINGENLSEIVSDMLEYWSSNEDGVCVTPFEITKEKYSDYEAHITLEGVIMDLVSEIEDHITVVVYAVLND